MMLVKVEAAEWGEEEANHPFCSLRSTDRKLRGDGGLMRISMTIYVITVSIRLIYQENNGFRWNCGVGTSFSV
jgi:hypothetical protein